MSFMLHGLTYLCCLVFTDDTVVMSRSFDEHLTHVDLVLQRFRQANLKLKPGKCKLFQHKIKFLGHVVSKDRVQVNPDKVASILSWPSPENLTELRGFIGICSYYRSFCENFSSVIEPLTEMLRKEVPIVPNEQRVAAFNKLKAMPTSPPVLAMPREHMSMHISYAYINLKR